MAATLDYPSHFEARPHRKPMPSGPAAYPSGVTGNDQIYTRQPTHSHTRSTSSTALPGQYPHPVAPYQNYPLQTATQSGTRRTLSNSTAGSDISTGAGQPIDRAPTHLSYDSSIHRSISSRSQQSQTSYVALLRRQKATVWCDHAQQEDPRVLAAQRQAKMRANIQVVGGVNPGSRTSTSSGGGVRSKIRHHGAVKASAYSAGNLSGAGVPMRLSASEVDDAESEEDKLRGTRYQQRSSSGRSSLSSGHRPSLIPASATMTSVNSSLQNAGRFSTTSTPPSRNSYSQSPNDGLPSAPDETPVPTAQEERDYFARPPMAHTMTANSGNSGSSGSSNERGFGAMAALPMRTRPDQGRDLDELRRRGSVDDRTMTMSGVRLFVANPDLSD